MRKVIVGVFCGTGIATSTMAMKKVEEEFEKRDIPVQFVKGTTMEVPGIIANQHLDLIIMTAMSDIDTDIPIFSGVPLLSGIGTAQLYEDIFAYVSTLDK